MIASSKEGLRWLLAQLRSNDTQTSRFAQAVAAALADAVASAPEFHCKGLKPLAELAPMPSCDSLAPLGQLEDLSAKMDNLRADTRKAVAEAIQPEPTPAVTIAASVATVAHGETVTIAPTSSVEAQPSLTAQRLAAIRAARRRCARQPQGRAVRPKANQLSVTGRARLKSVGERCRPLTRRSKTRGDLSTRNRGRGGCGWSSLEGKQHDEQKRNSTSPTSPPALRGRGREALRAGEGAFVCSSHSCEPDRHHPVGPSHYDQSGSRRTSQAVRTRQSDRNACRYDCGSGNAIFPMPTWRSGINIASMTAARVGNWYLEAEIGHGAVGVVYRARGYDDPDRRAAVKVFTAANTQDHAFVQNFAAEVLPLQRLDHANIAKFYDSGTHGGLAFVACELVEGVDCAKQLESGRRPWREVLSIAVQTARALKHAHNRNVLHRDLKPAHLMLKADGTLKVLGFGLAKVIPTVPTLPLSPIGSAAYAPPETASGKPLTRRSDFYSLGGVLYTLVTGRPPFAAASLVELMHKQCYTLPERPAMLVPDLPTELDEFICVLLDKNPARRPATAAAMLDELERIRGKLERKGEKVEWPVKLTPDTAETSALPVMLGPADGERDVEPRSRPLMSRPIVVFPLLALVLTGLVVAFAWPSPTAAELYGEARPLLESDNPDDWDTAINKYLDPLSRKYPDRYVEEIAVARSRAKDRRELRRAIAEGAKVEPGSDAERAYLRGLRLTQAGDPVAARRTWRALIAAYGPVPAETRWVELARVGVAALERPENRGTRAPPDPTGLQNALTEAKRLDPISKAAAFQALEELFRDDTAALEMIRAAQK
ncbi:MAG: hypothetical protein C0467_06195 [Planctomycetaceae bacterium]|nr:hypothetical protein [Planctomycetaceae bacterium]